MEPETIVGIMLESKEKWRIVEQFIDKLLSMKEEEERVVQRTAARD